MPTSLVNATSRSAFTVYDQVPAEIQPLIPEYLKRRVNDLRCLARDIASNDYAAIATIGHTMKGSGGAYGLSSISEIGSSLEFAALSRDRSAVLEQIRALSVFLERNNAR
jgi:HPt (histidine-containing phosphotransfer) domain-containing protein